MAIRKNKKNEIAVRNDENKARDLAIRRPYDLWADFDNLFDQFRSNFDDIFWNPATAITERTPLMDLVDNGDKYEVNLEMPGIPKDKINIEVTGNNIEISADYDDTIEDKGKNYLRRERTRTQFYRHFELPEDLKTDKIDAELNDGILKVHLPKIEPKQKAKSKKIKIK